MAARIVREMSDQRCAAGTLRGGGQLRTARIAVLGTGALGCVFAARLARVAEVTVLGTWSAGMEAIRSGGIRVRDADGKQWTASVRAAGDPSEAGPADFVLVLVKAHQTDRAAQWAAQMLTHKGLAVSLQNGLDNGPRLAATVGSDRCALGVTYTGATLLGPGSVHHVVNLKSEIGVPKAPEGRARELIALMGEAGLPAELAPDIAPALWGKAVANAAINPLTALWRVPNGGLLDTEDRRRLLTCLAEEAAAVARGLGIRLPYDDPGQFVAEVCAKTAPNRSSMLQDVETGRQTEIDSINGVIAREGERLDISVRCNEVVWRLVRGLSPVAGIGACTVGGAEPRK